MQYSSFSPKDEKQAVDYINYRLTILYLDEGVDFSLKSFMEASCRDLAYRRKKDGTHLMTAEKALTFVKNFPRLLTIAATTNKFKKLLRPNIAEIYDLDEALEAEVAATLLEYLGIREITIEINDLVDLEVAFGRENLYLFDTHAIESTNYLKLHRRKVKRGLNQIAYGIDYIPMYRDTPPSKKISSDREFIYDFKNGNYTTQHIRTLEKLVLPDFYVDLGSNLKFNKQCLILPIPASTKSKQQNRYNKFLIEFCQNKKNLINGFELVQILFDRPAKHISETRESKVNYKIDLKSISKLGNVDIIVFDDLVTQGSTISQFLNELGDHKDKVKQIITLGATV